MFKGVQMGWLKGRGIWITGCEERQVYRILFGLWIWFLKHQCVIDQAPVARAAFRNSV